MMASGGDGGLEKHFVDLCNGLADYGHEVCAICLPKYAKLLSDKVTHIPMDLTGSRHNPITKIALFNKLKAIGADIIHAQANKAAQILAPSLPWLNARSLVTIHNIKSDLNFTRKFDLTIGVSKGVLEKLPKTANSMVIYNGLHQDHTNANNKALPDDLDTTQPILLSVGRLVPAKGFDLLIEACHDLPCNLLIAGDGPEKAKLEAMLKSFGKKNNTWLLGHREDIPGLMNKADMVVISSRKEGFSYVFLEALLNQTPVISTDVPIPNEILPREYIADINAPAIRELISSSLQNKGLLNDFQKLFAFAGQQLTFTEQLKKTLQAYQQVLNQ